MGGKSGSPVELEAEGLGEGQGEPPPNGRGLAQGDANVFIDLGRVRRVAESLERVSDRAQSRTGGVKG